MGIPEKGSGWGGARSYSTNLESWSNLEAAESSNGSGARVTNESEITSRSSSEQNFSSNSCMSGKSGDDCIQPCEGQDWINDNDEENRSQSPGGLTMITSDYDTTSTTPQDDFMGINNWGNPKTKAMMGNNWKVPPSMHEKESYLGSEWDDSELSFNENSQYLTVSNGNRVLSNEQSFCQSEHEVPNDFGNYTSMGEASRSGAGTPNSRSSGGATPTQDTGGRTSAGSTSSVNSIGSSSSWKGDGKSNKTYTNRLGSPRKPSR